MADWDPATWSPLTRILYAIGVVYLAGFFVYFVRFRRAGRRAKQGDPADVARYNRMLRGFPNAFYAKLMGRRKLEPERGPPRGP